MSERERLDPLFPWHASLPVEQVPVFVSADAQALLVALKVELAKRGKRSCNRHDDCDAKPLGSDCCRDECCEECFGS